MIVAFLPGFGRSSAGLSHWKDLLPADVRLFDLPGHGGEPPIASGSLAQMAQRYAREIPPGSFVVGESLGGLVALAMGAEGYRAVAVDPPLSPGTSATLTWAMRQVLSNTAHVPWMAEFVWSLFGVKADGTVEARDHWGLLDRLAMPADIIGAGIPAPPPGAIVLTPATIPSVLDDTDAERARRHPMVRFRRVEGPHNLLSEGQSARGALLDILGVAG